jgi:hypothetical protein
MTLVPIIYLQTQVPKPVTEERGENRQPRTTTKSVIDQILNINNKARLRLVLRMCES